MSKPTWTYSIFFIVYLITHVSCSKLNTSQSCTFLYEKGVEAYLDNNYVDCIINFENAIEKYREYNKKLQNCRLQCRDEAELSEPLYPVDVDHLLFFEKTLKETLCLVKCKNKNSDVFGDYDINKETENLFQNRKPYEYLHICYFQEAKWQEAASAAFTYLVKHPDDKIMMATLKHYSALKGVDIKDIINYEAKNHVYLYVYGARAYDNKQWEDVINNMEESLTEYLQSEDECRAQCEGPFDHGWYPDFLPSIANHFTYCLKCKKKCSAELNSLNGEVHDDLLQSHFHYLQYAYFKLGKLQAACESVASYLLFDPYDETMLNNKKFYSKLPKVEKKYFTPRSEISHYVQRYSYENKLLKYISTEFQKVADMLKEEKNTENKRKFKIIKTEQELNGINRVVLDGLIGERDCKRLVDLVKMFAILGDGYGGQKSPHTEMEKFEGVTVARVSFLVYFGLLNSKHLKLFLDITENAKQRLQEYFHLKKKLYFSYTHLVCRSPFADSPEYRTDFSHKIHADNCNILSNGTCKNVPPAYFWRDYSAIIYLNSKFDGGEFVFASDSNGTHIQSTIKPQCGKMVAFSSGAENLHGVRGVKKGSRCAIGVWFTFNNNYREKDRDLAYKLLKTNLKKLSFINNFNHSIKTV